MYPAVHDYETYASEHGPGPVLASGIPNTSPTRPYAPPYVSPGMSAHVVAGKWSTGLCYCCDNPANCKDLKTHLASSLISSHKHQPMFLFYFINSFQFYVLRFYYLLLPLCHIWTDC